LPVNEYAFWEAIYLYNEIGDFLWIDPQQLVEKLSQAKMQLCLFYGQPKTWQQQFMESPNVPKPDQMVLEELKEHFKIKEDNAARSEQ